MTWNPIRARRKSTGKTGTFCTRISPGCKHCYASTINKRFGTGAEFEVPNLKDHEYFIDEKILEEPLRRKNPATIFVGDMFDLFHEKIPRSFIRRVIETAMRADWHTFQFLTKRADIMQAFMSSFWGSAHLGGDHMWFGVSVESQKYSDERIPLLLETPAAVRFLSVEPLLEQVTLQSVGTAADHRDCLNPAEWHQGIDWVICGGESGPGARPLNLGWAEKLRLECAAANVPFFMKQVGSNPRSFSGVPFTPKDSKGGDMAEWPERLRVREFPERKAVAV